MIHFIDAQEAFEWAITEEHLNTVKGDFMYAGNWMYMHSEETFHQFKNIETREYMNFTV